MLHRLIPRECAVTPPSSPTLPIPHSSQTTLLGQPGRSQRCTKADRRDALI